MAKKDGFAGGEMPTGLKPGQCGFDNIQSHTSSYDTAPSGTTVQVGREATLGMDGVESNGKK